jgi:hypothetical protein
VIGKKGGATVALHVVPSLLSKVNKKKRAGAVKGLAAVKMTMMMMMFLVEDGDSTFFRNICIYICTCAHLSKPGKTSSEQGQLI